MKIQRNLADGRFGLQQVGEEGRHHLLVAEDTLETVVCQQVYISVSALCHDGRQVELCRKATHFFANMQGNGVKTCKKG